MKKKTFAFLISLTCMITAMTSIPSGGEDTSDGITITSEHFVYNCPNPYNQESGWS